MVPQKATRIKTIVSKPSPKIVELMVRIAHTFGLEVVAEGVEDVATETVLREMGCDRAQGYLYAPAMSVEQFIVWWVSRQDVLLSAPAP